ncbi:hypothetical protein [Methylobacter sp. YRD-M1]|nr:hypothetical protein [Methylobacter sp. YRD-M1]WAK00990.1 hypothetical protein LZ558_14225 [Methylobacter sp. YRD-M1]
MTSEDFRCGAKPGQGCMLTGADEAVIVETRRKRLPPLDVGSIKPL